MYEAFGGGGLECLYNKDYCTCLKPTDGTTERVQNKNVTKISANIEADIQKFYKNIQ